MQIVIKFPDNYSGTDVQPFCDAILDRPLTDVEKKERETAMNMICKYGSVDKIGYRVFGKSPLVSIQKKDGYLYVEIDEQEVVSVEKRG